MTDAATSETTITRTLIVLPGATWRSELEAELVRLGVSEEWAPISAGRVLSRICKHAGYLNCFVRDEERLAEEAAEQEAVEDAKPKRSRAASRRRESRIVDAASAQVTS
jgi:hypothetical protein